ncbi:hypothetical protein [Aliarcobacter butzleri]|uniref:hypothetical protein n=1 Tax=Aliarcobacter butzleri TaxID=28197 RepID=UPI00344E3C6F
MSKIIDNNKYRVENATAVDIDEVKLISMISSNSFFIYIFICIALFNHLYYFAFTLFAFTLTFNVQKQIAKNKVKAELITDLGLVDNDNLNNKYSVKLGTLVKEHKKDLIKISGFNFLKRIFGTFKAQEIQSQVLTSSKNNTIAPVLFTDKILKDHTCLMATSGGGKSELLCNGYIDSIVAKGGGVFCVFGKSDNIFLQKIQSIAAKYSRLQDLLIYDFAVDKQDKTNSNTINMFELGNARTIITILVKMADFDNDTWGKGAKAYLTSFLKFVLTLRDANFFIDISKIDTVYNSSNKFEEYKKNIKTLDVFSFNKLITDNELLIKLLIIFDELYSNHKNDLNEILYKKFREIILSDEDNNTVLAHLSSEERNFFHSELKQLIVNQSRVPNWQQLKTIFQTGVEIENGIIKGLEALAMAYPSSNGVFYTLSVSIDNLKSLQDFFDAFPSILSNASSDISILDAIDSNKFVIMNLPGQNQNYSPIFASLVKTLLDVLLERRGKDYKSDTTSLVLLDEINSWLKTKDNKSYEIGNTLSVIRSLNMAAVLSFQSSLKETLGSVDTSQVFANTKTIITLQLEDKDLIEDLNKRVEKVKKLQLEENVHRESPKNKNQPTIEESKYTKTEEDYFNSTMLSSIKNGEGFIIRKSQVAKFMANYIEQTPMYKTEKDEIMLNRYISLEDLKKGLKKC